MAMIALWSLATHICVFRPSDCKCECSKEEFIPSARGMSSNMLTMHGQATWPKAQQCGSGCKATGRATYRKGSWQQHVNQFALQQPECSKLMRCETSWSYMPCAQPEAQCGQLATGSDKEIACSKGCPQKITIGWPAKNISSRVYEQSKVRANGQKPHKVRGKSEPSLINCSSANLSATPAHNRNQQKNLQAPFYRHLDRQNGQ